MTIVHNHMHTYEQFLKFSGFWATICKTVRPAMGLLSVCNVGVLWLNGWMDQDETWRGGRPRSWSYCIRWRPSSPSPKGAHSPIFGPGLLWPNGWIDQDATW